MREITSKSMMSELYELTELQPLQKYFIYMKDDTQLRMIMNVSSIEKMEPNGSLIYGLDRLRSIMQNGTKPICVYNETECEEDPERQHSNILFFPSLVENSDKPFVIIIPGGGYAMVCSLWEGYPIAKRFNELGYPAFVLNYRVGDGAGLFPKPMEDLAYALKYIYAHCDDFGLKADSKYIVGGFSAGGHISAEWGTDNEGYMKYGLPAPAALFLGYAAISSRFFISDNVEAMVKFRESIVGKDYTDEMEKHFSADLHVHSDYPPTYIVYCADDNMVDPNHSRQMAAALNKAGIRNEVEEGEKGGHGFALGFNTSADGWIDRANTFFEGLTQK